MRGELELLLKTALLLVGVSLQEELGLGACSASKGLCWSAVGGYLLLPQTVEAG